VLSALSERDETAEICRDAQGNPEPDPELRDTETVPLKEDVETYFKREVLPHVPDAWIDHAKTKVGYEIPLSFQKARIVFDGTVRFCERFVDPRSRTVDQMVQAVRSGKPNILEGSRHETQTLSEIQTQRRRVAWRYSESLGYAEVLARSGNC